MQTEFLALFPPPLKLVFEEKIYRKFLILTKKRYMALTIDEDLDRSHEELTARGVLLARRDNCAWIRRIYQSVVEVLLSDKPDADTIIMMLQEELCAVFRYEFSPLQDFVISKSVGDEYKSPPLSTDPVKRKQRLESLGIEEGASDLEERYSLRCEPAHVQLARKIERRGGEPFERGVRVPYVICEHPLVAKAKLSDKVEDPGYALLRQPFIRLDATHYAKLLATAIDQLLATGFPERPTSLSCAFLVKQHLMKRKVLANIVRRPRLVFPTDAPSSPVKRKAEAPKIATRKTLYDFFSS